MKHTPILKNTTRSIFFAGVIVFGMAGIVHAQNLGGPGQIGGMGQGSSRLTRETALSAKGMHKAE